MKRFDKYMHHKGKEYSFFSIALPLEDDMIEKEGLVFFQHTRHHEDSRPIELFNSKHGGLFIMSDVPHVIYQSSDDYGTELTWAREVDDFFDVVFAEDGSLVKRFLLCENK